MSNGVGASREYGGLVMICDDESSPDSMTSSGPSRRRPTPQKSASGWTAYL